MANENLPRVLQNIFGANATESSKTIAQFGSVIAGDPLFTGDIKQIQALQYWQNGWVGATISDKRYPTSEETTGINKVVTQQLAYLFQKGIPEWLDNETYFDGSFCQVEGIIYKSVKDNNINNNPVTDSGENWQIFRTNSETDLESLMPYVRNAVMGSNLSITNTHIPAGGVRYYNNGLTIENNTISGFSNTNWLILSKLFPSTVAYRVEHDFICTLPQLDQTIFGYNFNDSVGIRDGRLSLIIKGAAYKGITELQANQKYYWLLVHANSGDTAMKLYTKTDLAADWNLEVSVPIIYNIWADSSIYLGATGNNPNTYFRGTMSTNLIISDTASSQSGSTAYYDMSVGAAEAYDMLSVNGTTIGWCADGRNTNDKTLKNQSVTFNGNNNTILSPIDKDIYFATPNSRLIVGRTFKSSSVPTINNLVPGDIWYNSNTNVNQVYSTITPNLLNNNCTITNGVVSGFSTANYVEPFGVFDLRDNWSIKLALGSNIDIAYYTGFLGCSGIKLYTNQGISSTSYAVQKVVDEITTYGYVQTEGLNGAFVPAETMVFKDAHFTEELEVATGNNYIYNTARNFFIRDTTKRITEAKLLRKDIQKVAKRVEIGTSYQVAYQGVIGYVSTEGLAGVFVSNGTQIYSDSNLQYEVDTATGSSYIYTGNTSPIYDEVIGYAKTEGVAGQYLESGTIIYSDVNATVTLTTASGADYIFTDEYKLSRIAMMHIPQTNLTKNITLSYNGTTYTLSSEDGSIAFDSPDHIKDNSIVELGRCVIDDGTDNIQWLIDNSLDLINSEFSFWTWNNISTPTNQWTPFTGVKIGHTTGVTGFVDYPTVLASISDVNERVKKSGDIMTGALRFNNIKEAVILDNTIASSDGATRNQIAFKINDINVGYINAERLANGISQIQLAAMRGEKAAALSVYLDASGNATMTAVTPANGDNSTRIATTQWVKNNSVRLLIGNNRQQLTYTNNGSYVAPRGGWYWLWVHTTDYGGVQVADNSIGTVIQSWVRKGYAHEWAGLYVPVSPGHTISPSTFGAIDQAQIWFIG